MNAIAVIPARGGSRRLPRKNLAPLFGRPLVAWTVEAVRASRHLGIGKAWVSTDDAEIAATAAARGARIIERGSELSGDDVWTEPVIQHAVTEAEARTGTRFDLVLWLNASVPETRGIDIDRAIDRLLAGRLREVIAVDARGCTFSAVRALTREALFQRRLSVHAGILELPYLDVHTVDDLRQVRRRLERRFAWQPVEGPAAEPIPGDLDWELDDADWSPHAYLSVTDTAAIGSVLDRADPGRPLEVLEWGSGRGTIHLTRRLRERGLRFRWLSVEHDRGYFERELAPSLSDVPGVRVHRGDGGPGAWDDAQPASGCDQLEFALFDAGELRPFRADRAADRAADLDGYVSLPARTGRRFDLVLVDGRKRRRCLLEAARLLRPGGVVLLHDAWRPYYRRGFAAFPHHRRFGDLLWAGALDAESLHRWTGGLEISPDWLPP